MIDDSIEIRTGLVVRHDPEGGLLYRVEGVGLDTDGYEASHVLNSLRRVAYTQLENGDFPAGSCWDKAETQFRAYFTVVEDILTKDEFCEHWGPGAPRSWINLGKTALKNKDFPLQPLPADPTVMTGNLNEALNWLNTKYNASNRPGFVGALKEVQANRSEIEIA